MSVFTNIGGHSPVGQDFVWLAEYVDGTHLSEFDFSTKEENSFYDIQKEKLIRFGLVGHGLKLFNEASGIFNLSGQEIVAAYKYDGKEIPLMGSIRHKYNDIIAYKDAESVTSIRPIPGTGGTMVNRINQFNFGYKTSLHIDGVNFNFRALCCVPFNNSMYMNFRLVADQELDGTLVIYKNGLPVEEFTAPLSAQVGGELNWIVK